jgi:hypothetical protein
MTEKKLPPTTEERAASQEAAVAAVKINKIQATTMMVPIKGTTPLIVHNFSAKSRQMMLDAMQGRKAPAQRKDPEAEYQDAFYRMEDNSPGFPAIGFKAATVSAARFYGKNVKMTELRQFIFMPGIFSSRDPLMLVKINGDPVMREDTVRVGMGKADLRYRPMFPQWSATLKVIFVTNMLDLESVLSLIDAGGMGVGVGEWRPERRGEFGSYEVDRDKEIEVIA